MTKCEESLVYGFQASLHYMLIMGALYLTGALLYATRIPERFLPGKCDIWFQSHQVILSQLENRTNSWIIFHSFPDLSLVSCSSCICSLPWHYRDGTQPSCSRNKLHIELRQCVRMTEAFTFQKRHDQLKLSCNLKSHKIWSENRSSGHKHVFLAFFRKKSPPCPIYFLHHSVQCSSHFELRFFIPLLCIKIPPCLHQTPS